MKIIVTGATGTAGSEVVRQALQDPGIEQVTAIVRHAPDFQNPKLRVIIHKDFLDYSALTDVFKTNDVCIWCLGVSQMQVNKQTYGVITRDYTVAAAKAMLAANPEMTFVFLSGAGADRTEKTIFRFGKVKGQTENALLKLPFKKLYFARPAGILPSTYKKKIALYERFALPFIYLGAWFAPSTIITSAQLAKAMIRGAKEKPDQSILTNAILRQLAQ